jgi:hypothetical protein
MRVDINNIIGEFDDIQSRREDVHRVSHIEFWKLEKGWPNEVERWEG